MQKTILLTGSTDGIGFETALMLVSQGHKVLLHGRNPEKLKQVEETLSNVNTNASIETYIADLSDLSDVEHLAKEIAEKYDVIDVMINNAGVYGAAKIETKDGLDARYVVNTIAPYLLTKRLLPLLGTDGRVVNLSSAAQGVVNLDALLKPTNVGDGQAYAQSKLAITMWSREMALSLPNAPIIVAVNPKSLLGSKMVKDAYGVTGGDLRLGADILVRAALSDEFADASGKYFDNDIEQFASPHPDALDCAKTQKLVAVLDEILLNTGHQFVEA